MALSKEYHIFSLTDKGMVHIEEQQYEAELWQCLLYSGVLSDKTAREQLSVCFNSNPNLNILDKIAANPQDTAVSAVAGTDIAVLGLKLTKKLK